MSIDESLIYVLVSWMFHNGHFFIFLRPENAVSAHSSTGLIKSMILDILVLGLKISSYTTTFSM